MLARSNEWCNTKMDLRPGFCRKYGKTPDWNFFPSQGMRNNKKIVGHAQNVARVSPISIYEGRCRAMWAHNEWFAGQRPMGRKVKKVHLTARVVYWDYSSSMVSYVGLGGNYTFPVRERGDSGFDLKSVPIAMCFSYVEIDWWQFALDYRSCRSWSGI